MGIGGEVEWVDDGSDVSRAGGAKVSLQRARGCGAPGSLGRTDVPHDRLFNIVQEHTPHVPLLHVYSEHSVVVQ